MTDPRRRGRDDARRGRWAETREQFRRNAPHLLRQGSVVAKRSSGRTTWVLRCFVRAGGRSVHRSVHLCGDDEPALLRRARRLLRLYRGRSAWAKEVALFARVAGAANCTLRRLASRGRPGG